MTRPSLINLGCGHRYHAAWTNVDLQPADPSILRVDLGKPLPFADGSFDAVYHSNVLEHIRRPQAAAFMAECARICRSGGILRVAVPDLEVICRIYLEKLGCCLRGETAAQAEYEWIMLELLDQMIRETSGGDMGRFLRRTPLPAEDFVYGRIGNEGREFVEQQRQSPIVAARRPRFWKSIRCRLASMFRRANDAAMRIGNFRLSGEVHQWMYDRYSLGSLMKNAGFLHPRVVTPERSDIPGWDGFHLEVAPDGSVNKPDSLVMEATKS